MKIKKTSQEAVMTSLISNADMRSVKYKIIYGIVIALLALLSLATIFPTLWIFLSAFKDTKEFLRVPPTIIPQSFEPQKVAAVWQMVHFGRYFKNSVFIILGCLICAILFNGMAGYVFSKLKPLGSNFIYKLIFYTMLLPTSMNMIPLYSEFVKFPILGVNLMGTFFPMWMMSAISAFDILLFRSFFNSIPTSIVEAAKIEGASDFGIFTRIIIPLSKPIIMVVSIFTINGAWANFFWPFLILKNENMHPVAVMLYSIQSSLSADKYMVVMMLSILPPLVIFFCLSKYIMGGANLGSIKG